MSPERSDRVAGPGIPDLYCPILFAGDQVAALGAGAERRGLRDCLSNIRYAYEYDKMLQIAALAAVSPLGAWAGPEAAGANVVPMTTVLDVRPADGGYTVTAVRTGTPLATR